MNDKTQTEDGSVSKHFHLVGGTVLFSVGEEAHNLVASAIVKSDSKDFPVSSLIKAQRNLQGVLFTKLNEPQAVARDIVVTSVSYLGCMSTDDFYRVPDEVQAEMNEAVAAAGGPVFRSEEELKAALAEGGVAVQ